MVLEKQLEQKDVEVDRLRQKMNELRQNTNSGNDSEVVTILRQQNTEMKKQVEQQKQDNKRQRKKHKREIDELRDLLRQSVIGTTKAETKGQEVNIAQDTVKTQVPVVQQIAAFFV